MYANQCASKKYRGKKNSIVIPCAVADQKHEGDGHGHEFGHNEGEPNAVYAKNCGKDEDSGHLEDQGAQKRDDGRCDAVVQRGEEAGAVDGVPHEEEG